MTASVVDIDRARPVWASAVLDCDSCGHAWCAPVHASGLERDSILCEDCHELAAAPIATVPDDTGAPLLGSYLEALALSRDPRTWEVDG